MHRHTSKNAHTHTHTRAHTHARMYTHTHTHTFWQAITAIVKQNPNPSVLKATLGALAVLSSDERNLSFMREEGMEQLVEKFAKVKDDRVQMFVKQLKDRLYANES